MPSSPSPPPPRLPRAEGEARNGDDAAEASESRLAGELDARAAVECRSSAMAAAAAGRGAREWECALAFLFPDDVTLREYRDRGERWRTSAGGRLSVSERHTVLGEKMARWAEKGLLLFWA